MIKFIKRLFAQRRAKSFKRLADANYKRYKKWLNSHAPTYASGKIELRRVRTSKAGVNYYLPKDLLQLTMERKAKIEEYQAALGFGMTKQQMIEILEGAITTNKEQAYEFGSNNKKAHQKLNMKLQMDLADAVVRLKTINTADVMLRISLLYFFVDNEDPYTINQETQSRKYQEAQEDDDLRAFFLQTTKILLSEIVNKETSDSQS